MSEVEHGAEEGEGAVGCVGSTIAPEPGMELCEVLAREIRESPMPPACWDSCRPASLLSHLEDIA